LSHAASEPQSSQNKAADYAACHGSSRKEACRTMRYLFWRVQVERHVGGRYNSCGDNFVLAISGKKYVFQSIVCSVDRIQPYTAYPGKQARGLIGITVVVIKAGMEINCTFFSTG
jgi:hypothetical protein